MQPPSSPSPANQILKYEFFRQKFVHHGRCLSSEMLAGTIKISLTEDTLAQRISDYMFVFQTLVTFSPQQVGQKPSDTLLLLL
jgi:hypothetical protein